MLKKYHFVADMTLLMFEEELKKNAKLKSLTAFLTANIFVYSIKNDNVYIWRTGPFGISGGQPCFKGKCTFVDSKLRITGTITFLIIEKIIMVALLAVPLILFLTKLEINSTIMIWALIAAGVVLCLVLLSFSLMTYVVFIFRNMKIIDMLHDICKSTDIK